MSCSGPITLYFNFAQACSHNCFDWTRYILSLFETHLYYLCLTKANTGSCNDAYWKGCSSWSCKYYCNDLDMASQENNSLRSCSKIKTLWLGCHRQRPLSPTLFSFHYSQSLPSGMARWSQGIRHFIYGL